jgi:hypothetical protein
MANKDFVVKNGLSTGTNSVSIGTALTVSSNGNVGIANTTPANKLSIAGTVALGNTSVTGWVNASSGFYGTVQTATQGTIDHNSLSNYSADRHIAHSTISITAGTGLSGGGTIDANRTLNVTNVPNALTINNGGAGSASGTTFNGSSAVTISYNSIGAPSTTGTNASGTWSISINGSAASATNATYATSAGSATNATYATSAGSTSQSLTFASDGTGAISGTTFNGGTARVISYNSIGAPKTDGTNASGTWSININGSAASATNASAATNATYATSAGSTSQAVTFNNGGAGAASGTTFNGGTARTISYNSIGAPSTTGTNASGTWSININGSAASATNASAATNATYATSAGSATNATYATSAGTFTSISQDSRFNSIGVGMAAQGSSTIYAMGDIVGGYSDERLKTDIKPIENALEKVMSISGVNFRSNDLASTFGYNETNQVGVLAQELEKVLPQVVRLAPFDVETVDGVQRSISGENYKTVQYERIVPLLIEAIKQLAKEVEDLKSKV